MTQRSSRAAITLAIVIVGCDGHLMSDERTDAGLVPPARDAAVEVDAAVAIAEDGGPPRPPPDAGSPTGAPMFVAIGKGGRITTSCDDGRTWAFDRDDGAPLRCGDVDCDHHPGSSTGLTYGGGWFFASFGWGEGEKRLFRSHDGVRWELAHRTGEFSFAGIVWAGDRLIAGDATPRRSLDHGAAFAASEWPAFRLPEGGWPNARQVGYAPEWDRIMLVAAAGDGSWSDSVISSDGGATFAHPERLPEECRGYSVPPVAGGGVWLQAWAGSGVICRSLDGGETWTAGQIPGGHGDLSNVVWTGAEFVVYAGGRGWRSADGARWTEFAVDATIGAFARDPRTGTYAGVRTGWGQWYEDQRFYRSSDGAHWEELPASAAVRGHPITHVIYGEGAPSDACPARR